MVVKAFEGVMVYQDTGCAEGPRGAWVWCISKRGFDEHSYEGEGRYNL